MTIVSMIFFDSVANSTHFILVLSASVTVKLHSLFNTVLYVKCIKYECL
nr:hypothetical protein NJLGDECI_00114 [Cydia pomonella granulovirus]